jgi:hypothetical protein
MAAGIEITNPSGKLIISAEAVGYRYLGQPTLVTSGSIVKYNYTTPPYNFWYGDVFPYEYEITVPNSGMPLVGVKLTSAALVEVTDVWRKSGNTWGIKVQSIATSGSLDSINSMSLTAPDVYVFCPYDNSDNTAGAGVQLFDASSNLTFSTKHKPLWIRQGINFPAAVATYTGNPSYTWSNQTLYDNGQSASWTSLTFPLIVNAGGNAEARGIKFGSSETIYTGSAGFTISGSTMYRKRYLFQQETRIWETDDDLEFTAYATTVLVVDGAIL